MVFEAWPVVFVVAVGAAALLLARARARAAHELEARLVQLTRSLNSPEPLTAGELLGKRALLYANKKNLEQQMSRTPDPGAAKAYRGAIDRNQRSLEELERQLPGIEALRKKIVVYDALAVVTILCVAAVAYAWAEQRGGGSGTSAHTPANHS